MFWMIYKASWGSW